ncbi:Catalase [Frankliniella fusca]|uniref:Catalase n=1 Tax=Frankliniella fusca TaxID=407009 RepID=A0AAE1LII4_9NEOP|nr:Catalase [Frankliniella fusca]
MDSTLKRVAPAAAAGLAAGTAVLQGAGAGTGTAAGTTGAAGRPPRGLRGITGTVGVAVDTLVLTSAKGSSWGAGAGSRAGEGDGDGDGALQGRNGHRERGDPGRRRFGDGGRAVVAPAPGCCSWWRCGCLRLAAMGVTRTSTESSLTSVGEWRSSWSSTSSETSSSAEHSDIWNTSVGACVVPEPPRRPPHPGPRPQHHDGTPPSF